MTKIRNLKEKIVIGIVLVISMIMGKILEIPCIFLWLTGYECIGCGMTRALLCALKFDFSSAFAYHWMFWSVPILGLYVLFDGKPFKNKFLNAFVLILIGIGFAIHWIWKIM